MSKRFSFWKDVIIAYAILFLLIILSSCKTSRRVVKVEETKENTDSTRVENRQEMGFTVQDIEESLRVVIDKRAEGELFVYDTSRMYEEDGVRKAPLMVHYVTRDSVRVEMKNESVERDSVYYEKTDTLMVDIHHEKEVMIKKDTSLQIKLKVFSLLFIVLLTVCMFVYCRK